MLNFRSLFLPERCRVLEAHDRESMIGELVKILCDSVHSLDYDAVLSAVMKREKQFITRIAPEIALPHAQIEGLTDTYIAAGISPQGIEYDSGETSKVRLFFLVVGDPDKHLKILSAIAGFLMSEDNVKALMNCRSGEELYSVISGREDKPASFKSESQTAILDSAWDIAVKTGAEKLFIHSNDSSFMLDWYQNKKSEAKKVFPCLVLVQDSIAETFHGENQHEDCQMLILPFIQENYTKTVSLSLLLAFSEKIIGQGEKAVSVLGSGRDKNLNIIELTDIDQTLGIFYNFSLNDKNKNNPKMEIIMKVVQIATELSREGREGKPVGAIFIVGGNVEKFTQQMVVNPFRGYDETEKNILDPSLDETLKEFSRIDGAIIISKDGVILSAGTYLRIEGPVEPLPSGLGARHTAAAGISMMTDCFAVVLSESTGQISLFYAGVRVMVL